MSEGQVPQTPADPATTPTSPATPAVKLEDVLAENAKLKERERTLSQSYNEIRSFATRKSQEAANYKKMIDASATQDADLGQPASTGAARGFDDARLQAIEANQAIIQFKMDHRDFDEVIDKSTGLTVWGEINRLLDEANPISQTLAGATPYLTLKNAYREVRLQQFQKAKAEAPAAQATSEAQRNLLRARAATSGQAGAEGQEVIDVDSMTPQQMVDAGLVDVDPFNPPSHARKGLFGA